MKTRFEAAMAALCVVGMATACGDSTTHGGSGPSIMTTVVPGVVTVGETAQVSCSLAGWHVPIAELDVVVLSEPEGGAIIDGDQVTPTVAGIHTLRCAVLSEEIVDDAGATLEAIPGAPAKVVTLLESPTVQVFETTTVRCVVTDEYENPLHETTSFMADEGVTVVGQTVSSSQIGTYLVRCLAEEAGLEEVPADLDVTAGDPADVTLDVIPDLDAYALDSLVTITWTVTDIYGNEVPDVPGEITLPPSGLIAVGDAGTKFRFEAEGLYTVTVTLDEPYDLLTDSVELLCDETGPAITITWPERGAMIEATGEPITVEGSVADPFGQVVWFEINDDPVAVAEDGSFTLQVDPDWGVNVVRAVSEDEYGNISKLSPSYTYSSLYLNYDETDASGVEQDDGIELLLGQPFLDDGDHDHADIDDMATLLEVLLSDLDIPALVDSMGPLETEVPLIDQEIDLILIKLTLEGKAVVSAEVLEGTDIGPTRVTLDSREGGIDTFIEIGTEEETGLVTNLLIDLSIPITLTYDPLIGPVEIWEISASATATTALSIAYIMVDTKLDVEKETGQPLQMDIVSMDMELDGIEIDPLEDLLLTFETIDLPLIGSTQFEFMLSELVDINALTDQLLDPLVAQLTPTLLDALKPIMETFVGEAIGGLVTFLEIDTTVDVPDVLGIKDGEELALDVYTRLSSVHFTDDGGQIGFGLGLYAEKGIERDPLGAIQRAGCLVGLSDSFVYDWNRSAGLAIKTDVINSALFAIWWSGYLDGPLDVSDLLGGQGMPLPLENMELSATLLLPPVINDCGPKGVVEIQIGDVLIDLNADMLGIPVHAVFYADASAGIFFSASEEGLNATLGDFKFLEIEVLQISDGLDDIIDVKDLLENQLAGLLGGLIVGQNFGPIELPPINLGEMVPGLEQDAELHFVNLAVTKDEGYVVVAGDLD